MLIKYFNLLIIFGILFLETIGTFVENNESSAKIQIRKKRVINPAGTRNNLLSITEANYVVSIEYGRSMSCVGSILLPRVIITVAHCVEHPATQYQIFAGSHILGSGSRHNVSHKIVHEHYNPRDFENDVALLIIYPFIRASAFSHRVEIYQGTINANSIATIISWGSNTGEHYNLLQKINVPLVAHDRCANIYQRRLHISAKNICTFDPIQRKRCGVGDFGAPLVIENQLVGMYIWTGPVEVVGFQPDVFILLNHADYREWIRTKLQYIAIHF